MRKRTFLASMVAGLAIAAAPIAAMADGHLEKHNLLPNKPFAGTKLNILSVVLWPKPSRMLLLSLLREK